jgi:hypothetical protein
MQIPVETVDMPLTKDMDLQQPTLLDGLLVDSLQTVYGDSGSAVVLTVADQTFILGHHLALSESASFDGHHYFCIQSASFECAELLALENMPFIQERPPSVSFVLAPKVTNVLDQFPHTSQ